MPSDMTVPVHNRVFVLVLQHPREKKEALATAPALVAGLARAALVTGLSWRNLSAALGRPADPGRWAVLYLGSARRAARAAVGEIVALDRRGEPLADQRAALAGIEGIVLLDGSWKEAKSLWWRNPWLLKLRRIVLDPARPSRYRRLRREPSREALSTFEAAALALSRLDPGSGAAAALEARLEALLAAADGGQA
ncbi:MAG TPA: DTW domain-containing protein [Stellaceae bacterium]|nr:DTW domain-containing protein [Stellaceae bacterium]